MIDAAYPLSEMDQILQKLLKGKPQLFYDPINPFFDKKLKPFKTRFKSAGKLLEKFREIKDETEISKIKKAISISIHAHKQVAKALKPGINERALAWDFYKIHYGKRIFQRGLWRDHCLWRQCHRPSLFPKQFRL